MNPSEGYVVLSRLGRFFNSMFDTRTPGSVEFGAIVFEREIEGVSATFSLRDPQGFKLGKGSLEATLPWRWPEDAQLIFGVTEDGLGDLIVGDRSFDEFFQIVSYRHHLELFAVLTYERRAALLGLVRELRRASKSLELRVFEGRVYAEFVFENKRKFRTHHVFENLGNFLRPMQSSSQELWASLIRGVLSQEHESIGFKDQILALAAKQDEIPPSLRSFLGGEEGNMVELLASLHGLLEPSRATEVVIRHARMGGEHPEYKRIIAYLGKTRSAHVIFDRACPIDVREGVLIASWELRAGPTPNLSGLFGRLLEEDERLCAALVRCVTSTIAQKTELDGEHLEEHLRAVLDVISRKATRALLRKEIVEFVRVCGVADDVEVMQLLLEQRADDHAAGEVIQWLARMGAPSVIPVLEEISRDGVHHIAAAEDALLKIRARHADKIVGGLTLADVETSREGGLTLVSSAQGGITLSQDGEEPA